MNNRQRVASHSHGPAKRDSFAAELLANPRLAEAYIKASQELYDKQVKSGKLAPEEARKAKVLLKQFHREMNSVIMRHELAKLGKRILRMKVKRRLNVDDWNFVKQCLEEEIPALQRRLSGVMKDQRPKFETFLKDVEFDILLFCERIMMEQVGKAKTKELLAESGMQLLSEMHEQAKRSLGSKRKRPAVRRLTRPGSRRKA